MRREVEPEGGPFDWLETNDGRIRFLDSGGAADHAVMVLHGLANSIEYCMPLLASLSRNVRTIGVDIPGFGWSARPEAGVSLRASAAAIEELLGHLGLKSVTLAGHSMGGAVAAFAAAGDTRVQRLVLISAAVDPASAVLSPSRWSDASIRAGATLFAQAAIGLLPVPNWAVERIVHHSATRSVVLAPFVSDTAAFPAQLLRELSRVPRSPRSTIEALRIAAAISIASLLTPLRQPIHLITGERDALSTPSALQTLAAECGAASFEVMPATGHWPQLERPDELASLMIAILRTHRTE